MRRSSSTYSSHSQINQNSRRSSTGMSSPDIPWKSTALLPHQISPSVFTIYHDVTIYSFQPDSQVKAILEIFNNHLGDAQTALNPKTGDLLVEVAVDWLAASSFRLPNLVQMRKIENELMEVFRKVDLTNRFVLKLSYVALPFKVTYKLVKGEKNGNETNYVIKSSSVELSLSPRHNMSTINITDCFRIAEKGRFSSANHFKIVYDLAITKELAVQRIPLHYIWAFLTRDLIADNFQKQQLKHKTMLKLEVQPIGGISFELTYENLDKWSNDWLLDSFGRISGVKKIQLRLFFSSKSKITKPFNDLEEFITDFSMKQKMLLGLFGENFDEQMKLLTRAVPPEEIPSTFSGPFYSYEEISQESWGLHTVARSFLLRLKDSKSYATAVIDLAKKQLPRMQAVLGHGLLVGFKLTTKARKMEIYVDFIEEENMNERHITNAGVFKAKEFESQFVFNYPVHSRGERLIDEVYRLKSTVSSDSNGNLPCIEEILPGETEINGNKESLP